MVKEKNPFTDLLNNEKLTKETYLFHIKHSRVSEKVFFLKLEVFNHKKESIFRFKVQIDPNEELMKLKVDESLDKVGLLSIANKNIFELVKEGVEGAISNGKIPFFPGN